MEWWRLPLTSPKLKKTGLGDNCALRSALKDFKPDYRCMECVFIAHKHSRYSDSIQAVI